MQVLSTVQLFEWIKAQIYSCDSHIISSLDTFNAILTRCQETKVDPDQTFVEHPPIESPKQPRARSPSHTHRGTVQPIMLSVEKLVTGMPKKTEHLLAPLPQGCPEDDCECVDSESQESRSASATNVTGEQRATGTQLGRATSWSVTDSRTTTEDDDGAVGEGAVATSKSADDIEVSLLNCCELLCSI